MRIEFPIVITVVEIIDFRGNEIFCADSRRRYPLRHRLLLDKGGENDVI